MAAGVVFGYLWYTRRSSTKTHTATVVYWMENDGGQNENITHTHTYTH